MTALAAADAAPSTGDASDAARPRVRHLATETFVTVKFDIVTDLNEAGFATAQAFLDVVTERFTEAVSSGEWRERIFRNTRVALGLFLWYPNINLVHFSLATLFCACFLSQARSSCYWWLSAAAISSPSRCHSSPPSGTANAFASNIADTVT